MNIKMRKGVLGILLGIAIVLCTIFSFSIIFIDGNKTSAKGGIVVENGANVAINGGILQDNNQAIVIEGGEHTISNVKISGSTNGAVIIAAGSIVTIENSIIEGNTNTGNGGAIFVGEGATLNLVNTKILNNTTPRNGGAIYAEENAKVVIDNNTKILNNSGFLGGAIYLVGKNSEITNNGFIEGNISTKSSDVWQNIYMEYVSITAKYQYSNATPVSYYGTKTANLVSSEELFNSISIMDFVYQEGWYAENSFENKLSQNQTIDTFDDIEGKRTFTLYSQDKVFCDYSRIYINKDVVRTDITGKVQIPASYKPNSSTTCYPRRLQDKAFQNCQNITSIEIAYDDSASKATYLLMDISGGAAFENCYLLETLPTIYTFDINGVIGDSAGKLVVPYQAFNNCYSLKYNPVNLFRVTAINSYAYQNCKNITSIECSDFITSIATGAFNGCEKLETITIPRSAPDSVISIGKEAFNNCVSLTLFDLNQGVSSLGESAFANCKKLSSINLNWVYGGSYVNSPSSITSIQYNTFNGCSSLVAISLPDTITAIGSYAFANCSALENINIAKKITTIGTYSFRNCKSLDAATFESAGGWHIVQSTSDTTGTYVSVKDASVNAGNLSSTYTSKAWKWIDPLTYVLLSNNTYGVKASYKYYDAPLEIPATYNNLPITEIVYGGFKDCNKIELFELPDSIVTIRGDAFLRCTALTEFTIGDNIKTIEYGVFYGTGLKRVLIGNGITTLSNQLFTNCASLEYVSIGKNVTKINSMVFNGCTNLKSVNVADIDAFVKVAYLNDTSNPFYYGADLYFNDQKVENLTINSTYISSRVFMNCASIKNVVIGAKVTEVRWSAFENCPSLESVDFSGADSLTLIDQRTFLNCSLLTGNIFVPQNVTKIGGNAFKNCTLITSVVFEENSVLEDIQGSAFENTAISSVSLPANLKKIRTGAFYNTNITSVEIPSSVERVGRMAFGLQLENISFENNTGWNLVVENTAGTMYANVEYDVDVEDIDTNITNYNRVGLQEKADIYGNYYYFEKDLVVDLEGVIYTLSSDGTYYLLSGLENTEATQLAVKSEHEGLPVSEIEKSALAGNVQIKRLIIPASITAIKYNAFYSCTAIERVDFAEDSELRIIASYAFYNCTSLKAIDIPASVLDIYEAAFRSCSNLQSVQFKGNLLTTIYDYTFQDCTKLETVNIPTNVTLIKTQAFYNCKSLSAIEIPSNVATIEYAAFKDCMALEVITFAEKSQLTTMASSVFANCGVIEITIPASFTTGNGWIFAQCPNLEKVRFEENSVLTVLPEYMFTECPKLVDVILPDSLMTIGTGAFKSCNALEYIVIPENVSEIQSSAFYNCQNLGTVVNKSAVQVVHGYKAASVAECADMVFSNEVVWTEETIGGIVYRTYTAKDGTEVQFITKDNSEVQSQTSFKVVVDVMDKTLATYDLADDIDAIGYSVFESNENLTHITLPASVKSIGFYAFRYCYNLAVICNLSELALINLSHETSDYGYMTWYLGELYTTPIDVVENIIDNVVYLDIFNAEDTEHSLLIDRVVCGYESTLSGDVILDSAATVIAYKAFEGATITSVTLPENFRKIQYKAFDSGVEIVLGYSKYWQQYNSGEWVDLDAGTAASTIASKPGYVYYNRSIMIDDVRYLLSNDNTHYVVVDCGYTITDIVIQDYVKGLPVTEIAGGAFKDNTTMQSVTIPERVNIINSTAFSGASNLTMLNIEGSWMSDKKYTTPAGQNTSDLTYYMFNTDGEVNLSLFNSEDLANYTLTRSDWVFEWNEAYEFYNVALKADNKLTGLPTNCNGLPVSGIVAGQSQFLSGNTLRFPTYDGNNAYKNIKYVGPNMWQDITFYSVETDYLDRFVEIDFMYGSEPLKGNTLLIVTHGNIDATAGTVEIILQDSVKIGANVFNSWTKYEHGIYITLPYTCTSVGYSAFRDSTLTFIELNEGLEEIGQSAFMDCRSIKEIIIPSTVTKIGNNAFAWCTSITTFKFAENVTFHCYNYGQTIPYMGELQFVKETNYADPNLKADWDNSKPGYFGDASDLNSIWWWYFT